MKYKRSGLSIFLRTAFAFVSLFLLTLCILKAWYVPLAALVPLVAWQLYDFYRFNKKAQQEVEQFVESIHYRDFTRHFEVTNAPAELQPFRYGFNQINSTFKLISREKEIQHLHLKTILEIVDTGILSYETESGAILWMNESLKNLLQIPYLKTIHSLEKRNEKLYAEVLALEAGTNRVTEIARENSRYKILLASTAFQNEGKTYKLIAFQNINEALEESESQAWQKLLSVLTHEIMNSVAPIASLAETLKKRIQELPESSEEQTGDIETGIDTIIKRSDGLLKFTETYRNLSKIKTANKSEILLAELFEHVQQLLQPTLDKKNISLEIILRDPFLTLGADTSLLEQVLINLVLNAIDAVKDRPNPRITISGELTAMQKVVLKVSDNGTGISPEVLDKIFVPFFSTKKTGSGIGLSLCKQVMMLHKGQVQVQSVEGEGTVFSLVF